MRPIVLAPILLFAAASSGCAGYWADRGADLDEVVIYSLQFGYGLEADARVGILDAGVGLGSNGSGWGKPNWWAEQKVIAESNAVFPLTLLALMPSDNEDPSASRLDALEFHRIRRTVLEREDSKERVTFAYERAAFLGVQCPFPWRRGELPAAESAADEAPSSLNGRQWGIDGFSIEAGLFAGVVGARVGVNLAELCDFILGFTGLDILGDDARPEPPSPTVVPNRGLPPAESLPLKAPEEG